MENLTPSFPVPIADIEVSIPQQFQDQMAQTVGGMNAAPGGLTANNVSIIPGAIKSGQTDYNTGTGFWMGYTSGVAKFSVGDGTSNYMTWDGTTLNVTGFKLQKTFIAFENIAAGAPVSMWFNGTNVPAYNNSASGTASGAGDKTASFSCTGSNRILVVFVACGDAMTGVTYNGVAMTEVDTAHVNQNKAYILIAPASGSNTLTFSHSGGGTINWIAMSYTGAKQSSQPSVHGVTSTTGSASVSITPAADGELVVGGCFDASAITATVGISNHTNSLAAGAAYAMAAGDGAGVQGSLSYTVSDTGTGGANSAAMAMSISPATAVTLDGTYCANASSAVAGYKSKLVGFANQAMVAGAAGVVVLSGIIDTVSGLTPGSYYYLKDPVGTIGTTAGTVTVKVGFALTATSLLVTNIW